MKKTGVLMVIAFAALLMASPAFAGHFEGPAASLIQMHIAGDLKIDGQAARPGDEVGVFDSDGKLIGAFSVRNEGTFGDMVINGDYELIAEKEGAKEGEGLFVKVWQASSNREYSGDSIKVLRPEETKAIYVPFDGGAFRFAGGTFYLLDIETR